ncbi:MAG: hypothetical protein ACREQL_07150 [Candidatus Binatia bacterium]
MQRRELLAYVVGAAVAGTLLVGPYTGRAIVASLVPVVPYVPFFLLPVVWGIWNWLYVRLDLRLDVGAWGAVLGLVLGLAVGALFYVRGTWFAAAGLLPLFLPVAYFLLWRFVVGPLNEALGVAGRTS